MVANGLQFLQERASGPQQRVIVWTPAMAEDAFTLYNNHERQRGFRKGHAEMLKRIMDSGEWREPWFQTWIAFQAGEWLSVVNGQHTLWAIWKHGKPIKVWTAWNLDDAAISSFDNFKSRTAGVLAQQAGLDHANHRNAVAKLRLAIDEQHGRSVVITVGDTIRLTSDDALMDACIRRVVANERAREFRSLSCVAYAMWKIASVHGIDKAFAFIDSTIEGANMQSNDPRLHLGRFLRQRLVATYNDRYIFIVGIIRAFNMWVSGAPVTSTGLTVKNGAKIPAVYGAT